MKVYKIVRGGEPSSRTLQRMCDVKNSLGRWGCKDGKTIVRQYDLDHAPHTDIKIQSTNSGWMKDETCI